MKQSVKNVLNHLTLLGIGLSMIAFGIIFFFYYSNILGVISFVLFFFSLGLSLYYAFVLLTNRKRSKQTALRLVVSIALVFIILFNWEMPFEWLMLILGIYVFLHGGADLVQFILDVRNGVTKRLANGARGLFLVIMSGFLVATPFFGLFSGVRTLSVYFIVTGGFNVIEAIFNWLPNAKLNRFKGKIRIKLPVVIEALTPKLFLNEINTLLMPIEGEDDYETKLLEQRVLEQKMEIISDEPFDLEVFVHVTGSSFGQVGHMDIAIDNTLYSFGSYDYQTYIFGGMISDGVYIEANKTKYLRFVRWFANKTVFGFGIKITAEQKEKMFQQLAKIKTDAYPWQSNYDKGVAIEDINEKDYTSRLAYYADAKLYKFYRGRYKKYFGMTTNCVLLVDTLLGPTGSNMFDNNGILTPGTYMNYLYNEVKKPNTPVVNFRIYRQ